MTVSSFPGSSYISLSILVSLESVSFRGNRFPSLNIRSSTGKTVNGYLKCRTRFWPATRCSCSLLIIDEAVRSSDDDEAERRRRKTWTRWGETLRRCWVTRRPTTSSPITSPLRTSWHRPLKPSSQKRGKGSTAQIFEEQDPRHQKKKRPCKRNMKEISEGLAGVTYKGPDRWQIWSGCYGGVHKYWLMDINRPTIGMQFSKTLFVSHNVHWWNGTAAVVAAAFFFINFNRNLVIYTVFIYNGGGDDPIPF